jgi:uncharacterized protein YdeI (YjbR/CyaY-like superfamily)
MDNIKQKDFSKLKRNVVPIPDDIEDILNSKKLMDAYRSRPPYQQNDYLGWILKAKRSDTREKRINQMIWELSEGNTYMKMDYTPRD